MLYVTSMAKPPLPRFPEDGPLGGSLSPSMASACADCPNGALPAEGDGETLYVLGCVRKRVSALDMEGSINASPVAHGVKDGWSS